MKTKTATIGEKLSWVKGKKPTNLFEIPNENTIPYLSASYFRTNKPDYYADVKDKNCVPVSTDQVVLIWDGSNAGDVFCGLKGALSSTMVKFNKSKECDTEFLYFLLKNNFNNLNKQTTGSTIPHVSGSVLKDIAIPFASLPEQKSIARVLTIVQDAITSQEELIAKLKELKRSMMQYLFTHGTKSEKTKMTEIGEVPESWEVSSLAKSCEVLASSVTFKNANQKSGNIEVLGIKVSDMNSDGNAKYISNTATIFHFNDSKSLIPPNVIIFPKRGAAIATNKKRMTNQFSLLDPNLIAVKPGELLLSEFVFYFFETFDLKKLTDSGTIPQLNKKDLLPIQIPVPQKDEQEKIVLSLTTLEDKIISTQEKLSAYQNFFKTLLHKLMSGERRVKISNNRL